MIPEGQLVHERMGLLLQRQLAEVGIDMRIEVVPITELVRRLPTGQFDAFLLDVMPSHGLDPVYAAWHSPEATPKAYETGYTAADGALDRLREARTEEETRQAVRALQQVMRDDPPAVFLLWSNTARAVSARFNVPLTPDRDIFGTLPQWTLAVPPDGAPAATPQAPPTPATPASPCRPSARASSCWWRPRPSRRSSPTDWCRLACSGRARASR
jgi:hypothetical protein